MKDKNLFLLVLINPAFNLTVSPSLYILTGVHIMYWLFFVSQTRGVVHKMKVKIKTDSFCKSVLLCVIGENKVNRNVKARKCPHSFKCV